jgi:DNA-binding transcriptional MerR regulator/mannose-6-phosphate isomerase-like protein (cupin superfamily)
VRHVGGQDFHTISEAAAIAGVSPQTLRVWEAKSLLSPSRTRGGQRLYSADSVNRAREIAQLRQQRGWNPAAIATALAGRPNGSSPGRPPRDGVRVREARKAQGVTIKELASRVGVSPAALSALERGEAAVSSAIIARIADALLVPMSALASSNAPEEAVIRAGEGPSTVNQGGVTWQELGAPGHDLEPAILTVPPGEGSGGSYSRPGETFVVLQEGMLAFTIWSPEPRAIELRPGDALTIPARTTFEWHNPGRVTSRALWVESLISRPVAEAEGRRRRPATAADGQTRRPATGAEG